MTQDIINRLKPYAVFDYYNAVDGIPDQQNFMVSTLSIPQHPVALCGPSREFADALCSLLNGSTLANLTPSGVERITLPMSAVQPFLNAVRFDPAKKRGERAWATFGIPPKTDDHLRLHQAVSAALALPSEPPSQGDVPENDLPRCPECGAPAGLDCRTIQGRTPPHESRFFNPQPSQGDVEGRARELEGKPCGGCGAKSNDERCIGCLHDFGTPESAWVRRYHHPALASKEDGRS